MTLHDAYLAVLIQRPRATPTSWASPRRCATALRRAHAAAGADAALGKAVGERRLLVCSAHPDEQAGSRRPPFRGVPQDGPARSPRGGERHRRHKLDYYLDRSLEYDGRGGCADGQRSTRVHVTLTNTAPAHGLPRYVTIRADRPTEHVQRGTEKLLVSVYLAQHAGMDKVFIDGKQGLAGVSEERGHTVVSLTLELAPGQTHSLTIDVTEPASAKTPVVPVQPLVRPQRTEVHVSPC